MNHGKIVVYFESRGFGFLHEADNGNFVQRFFHVRQCTFEPRVGALVQFTPIEGPKGPAAIDVRELVPVTGIEALAGVAGGK